PLRHLPARSLIIAVSRTDLRVPVGLLIGGLKNGWPVANTTLAKERAGLGAGGGGAAGGAAPGPKAGYLDKRAGDLVTAPRSGAAGALARRSSPLILDLAKGAGKADHANLPPDLMRLYSPHPNPRYTAP